LKDTRYVKYMEQNYSILDAKRLLEQVQEKSRQLKSWAGKVDDTWKASHDDRIGRGDDDKLGPDSAGLSYAFTVSFLFLHFVHHECTTR